MENKNIRLAKRELIQFLKQHKAIAVYFWTMYGLEYNSRNVKNILTKIEYETNANTLCQLYQDLIGKMRPNPNIKDKEYWANDTLYKVYRKWCEHVKNKFHNI